MWEPIPEKTVSHAESRPTTVKERDLIDFITHI
jgi:hypothetical protein